MTTKKKVVGVYELGRTLGEGTFGKVKFARNTETGAEHAIKILDKANILKQGMAEQIKKEISIMKMIAHPNIVTLKDVLVSKSKIYLVLELVTGGELFYKLVDQRRFNEKLARHYFHQLIDGVEFLHFQGVYHRDLKPENLLVTGEGNLKISDFGLSALNTSKDAQEDNLLRTMCGTPNYCSPDVLKDAGYSGAPADVWSCGVILYVFLAGYLPMEDENIEQLFDKILKAEFSFPPWFSPDAKDLISKILVVDPTKRYTINQIKSHKWFAQDYVSVNKDLSLIKGHDPSVLGTATVESESDTGSTAPAGLNAFQLMAMAGALDMSKMLLSNPQDSVKNHTVFTATRKPDDIIATLTTSLKALGFQVGQHDNKYSLKCKIKTKTAAHLQVYCQIYNMGENLNMVEFRRGRGSVLEYFKTYKLLILPALKKAGLVASDAVDAAAEDASKSPTVSSSQAQASKSKSSTSTSSSSSVNASSVANAARKGSKIGKLFRKSTKN